MAKPKTVKKKSNSVTKRKPTKASVKKKVQQRISKKAKTEWESKSHSEQTQYLKDHPDSKYQKLGVTKKADDNGQSNTGLPLQQADNGNGGNENTANPSSSNQSGNDTSSGNNTESTKDVNETRTETPENKEVETSPAKDEPLVAPADPKEPLLKRIKTGLTGIFKIDPSRIMEEAKEGYQEGLNKALSNPESHEEIKKRLEEYLKEPPKKAKDGMDLKTFAIGAAAILAIGGLAVAAPGLAIVIGLQIADKAPEIMGQLNERAQRKRQEAEEDFAKDEENRLQKHDTASQQLADIIGDTVGSRIEDDEELQDLVKKAVENDSNEEKSPEEPNKPAEQTDAPVEENTPTGEGENKEAETTKTATDGNATGDQSTNLGDGETVDNLEDELDEDYEDDDEDYEEEEEEPEPPKKKGRSKVKASVIEAFDAIDFDSSVYDKVVEKVVAEIKEKESTGTYAALKLHPSSARLLNKWAISKGVKNAFAAGDMHITVCYSRKPVDYKPLSFIHGAREVKPKDLGLLGREEDKKMLVLHLQDGGFPQRRFNYAKSIGASHDFPEYLPHISIAPPGHGYTNNDSIKSLDASSINFPLLVDYEYYNELHASDVMRDIPSEGYITNKPNPVRVTIASDEGRHINKDGAHLDFSKGDYILTDGHGDKWPVKPSVFKGKYIKQPDGTYEKGKINYSYKIHEEVDPLTIKTYEGPVVANKGDVIITGTEGEQWPVSRKRFDELYSVIVDNQVEAILNHIANKV